MPKFIVVTGAAGLIGSNIVKGLNDQGVTDIIAVDNLKKSDKFSNLCDCEIADYLDKADFLRMVEQGLLSATVDAVLHQGACSDTMESDGGYMMENNYRYSLKLLDWCQEHRVPFLYASSAAVYGGSRIFREERAYEGPLNVYGYSKFLFDQIVRRRTPGLRAPVTGFRYFNVYGPRENHKGRMASVAFHHFHQYRAGGKVKLFEGSDGYAAGGQLRDFVYVRDIVKANLHFLGSGVSGIYNLGTGRAQSFNDVAVATVNSCRAIAGMVPLGLEEMVDQGVLEYVSFPEGLKSRYQSFTQADLANLRSAGYKEEFFTVEEGVSEYVRWLGKIDGA